MANDNRNPLFIPNRDAANSAVCPKCGKADFIGRKVQGAVTFKCRVAGCDGVWHGGLPREFQDPRIPLPPESYIPTVRFGKDTRGNDIEIRRRPDTRPDFKKGAPIPEGDE
jgi:hypothetical protein